MAADIGQELFEQILKKFNEKYKKAQLFGTPISETLDKIKKGTATFRDADIYATEVGTMLSDAITETVIFDDLPNQTMYYNIAKKIIEPSLQEEYNLISEVATAVQDDYNRKIGTGLKAAKPEFNQKKSDNAIEKVVKAQSQESFNASVKEPVKTFALSVVDDTKKKNAEIHHKTGLTVKVTRTYDHVGLRRGTKHAEECSWCKERCGQDVPYSKALDKGMFERHDGCGCEIEYTSKKGEKTYSTGKYTGWYRTREKDIIEKQESSLMRKVLNRAEAGRNIENNRGVIANKVVNGEYDLKLKHQKYLQHVKGTPQYNNATAGRNRDQSYLTITEEDAQNIIYKYSGTGVVPRDKKGNYLPKEFVDVEKKIGYYSENGEWHETKRVQIIYSKTGSHIVPVKMK